MSETIDHVKKRFWGDFGSTLVVFIWTVGALAYKDFFWWLSSASATTPEKSYGVYWAFTGLWIVLCFIGVYIIIYDVRVLIKNKP
jgi:hypothetical protein